MRLDVENGAPTSWRALGGGHRYGNISSTSTGSGKMTQSNEPVSGEQPSLTWKKEKTLEESTSFKPSFGSAWFICGEIAAVIPEALILSLMGWGRMESR